MVAELESNIFLEADAPLQDRWLQMLIERGEMLLELDHQLFTLESKELENALQIQLLWRDYLQLLDDVERRRHADIPVRLRELRLEAWGRSTAHLAEQQRQVRRVLNDEARLWSAEEVRRELQLPHK